MNQSTTNYSVPRIAHGGGGFKGHSYTNSIEALSYNYDRGFRYFELDFSWTADNYLACIHDWQSYSSIPTLAEFIDNNDRNDNWCRCHLDSVITWLDDYPSTYIVTDIKDNNLKGLALIASQYPQYIDRFIPQIYQPQELAKIQKLGFKRIIWTLYLYEGSNEQVIEEAQNMRGDLYAVTMPIARAESGLAISLNKLNLPCYVHTINDLSGLSNMMNENGISNIYTDFLSVI